MPNTGPIAAPQAEYLTDLVYELLDAHEDTARLFAKLDADGPLAGLDGDPGLEAHLEYLRRLQRVGREALAWIGA
jgi:hypothetical protein